MLALVSVLAAEAAEKTESINPVVPDELGRSSGVLSASSACGSCCATSACRP